MTITSGQRTADIWYKNGAFWKFNAEQVPHEYRYKMEQEYINNKVIYDEMARQFWQQCQLVVIVPPASNFEPFPDNGSHVLEEELSQELEEELVKEAEEFQETDTEIVEALDSSDNNAQEVTPKIEKKAAGGIIIYVSKKHLPIEVVVVDSDAKLKVFRK